VNPNLYIVAGPNGAGKTTFAREFLPNYADCRNFSNVDLIAAGLAPLAPQTAAFRAGRLVLEEIERFANQRADFGFETTLSGRAYLGLIRELKNKGYELHIFFVSMPNVAVALSRIKKRVLLGGHDVPESMSAVVLIVPSATFCFNTDRWLTRNSCLTIPASLFWLLLRSMVTFV